MACLFNTLYSRAVVTEVQGKEEATMLTAASTQKKVLVAEADPQVAELIVGLLSRQRIEVIIAHEGREAVQKALAENPDAILLDSTLLAVGGIDICQILKSNKATRDIPLAFLTGPENHKASTAAQHASALMLIPKPFKPQHLISSVGLLLSSRRKKPAA